MYIAHVLFCGSPLCVQFLLYILFSARTSNFVNPADWRGRDFTGFKNSVSGDVVVFEYLTNTVCYTVNIRNNGCGKKTGVWSMKICALIGDKEELIAVPDCWQLLLQLCVEV